MRNKTVIYMGTAMIVLASIAFGVWHWRSPRSAPQDFSQLIAEAAQRHDIDPALLRAVIRQESNFDPDALGDAGEVGLMQITKGAAEDWARRNRRRMPARAVMLMPEVNVEIGSWYLAQGLRQWRDHEAAEVLALCQYNAGRSRALKTARTPGEKNVLEKIPIDSTKRYITDVLRFRAQYQ